MDSAKYPLPIKINLEREILSDAWGYALDSQLVIPDPRSSPLKILNVMSCLSIDRIQVRKSRTSAILCQLLPYASYACMWT
jgi:hypothetical protein